MVGEFNVVSRVEERVGRGVGGREMLDFNGFIADMTLLVFLF